MTYSPHKKIEKQKKENASLFIAILEYFSRVVPYLEDHHATRNCLETGISLPIRKWDIPLRGLTNQSYEPLPKWLVPLCYHYITILLPWFSL